MNNGSDTGRLTPDYDLAVVGAGPAGMAAALAARESGVRKIILLERGGFAGGILPQCIHNGFGLHYFGAELTGPEYAQRFIDRLAETDIDLELNTMVLDITADRQLHVISRQKGYRVIRAGAVILAMGCRERTRGAISLPGSRPAGIFCAGTAQRYMNVEGYRIGKKAVILGSGDIGLIMARRLTLEGAEVKAVVELMPFSNGLNRNIVQCLNDYDIPLYLSHTVTDIRGEERVTSVVVSEVDEKRQPIAGTEMEIPCDTLLLSVGLIPENELTRGAGIPLDRRTNGAVVSEDMQTLREGVFACGNVLHVHDLVDFVTREGEKAGRSAAAWLAGGSLGGRVVEIQNGSNVNYTVPQRIHPDSGGKLIPVFFRVGRTFGDSRIVVTDSEGRQVAAYTREHMAPGEMENIQLPATLLKNCTGLQIAAEERSVQQ